MTVASKKKPRPTTKIVKGWVVRMSFTKMEPDEKTRIVSAKKFMKKVSPLFSSREAAVTFCQLTVKYPPVNIPKGAENVEFFVTESEGFDDLKPDQSIT